MTENQAEPTQPADTHATRLFAPLRLAFFAILPTTFVCWVIAGTAYPPQESPKIPATDSSSGSLTIRAFSGDSSCARRGCHGGVHAPSDAPGSEYTMFTRHDPHARLGDLEKTPRYQHILKNVQASRKTECRYCHGPHPMGIEITNATGRGISCELCHGASQEWLTVHATPAWAALDRKQRADLGWIDLQTWTQHQKLCLDCHVGKPGVEVDHDLIAAGHPRLLYDAANWAGDWKPHWHTKPTKRTTDQLLDEWEHGATLVIQRTLSLIEARARKRVTDAKAATGQSRAWPELSHYACFSCHRSLTASTSGQTQTPPARTGRSPIPWGTWMIPLWERLARSQGRTQEVESMSALRKTMETFPIQTETVLQHIQAWQNAQKAPLPVREPAKTAALIQELNKEADRPDPKNWDEAAATYLILRYLESQSQSPDPNLAARRERLRFPKGQDSPGARERLRFPKGQDSPGAPK